MTAQRKPLTIQLAPRDAGAAKDGRLTNCYTESGPNGPIVVKRPGMSLNQSLGAGTAQMATTFNGHALFIKGDNLYTANSGYPNISAFSTLTTPTLPSSGSSVGTARPGYLVSDGTNLYSIGGRNNGAGSTNVYKSINNGTSWTLAASAVWTDNLQFSNIACFFNSKIRVLHKNAGTGKYELWSSPDGVTWTMDSSDIGLGVTSIGAFAYITNGTTIWAFFGLASGGTGQVWSSTNGTSFSQVTSTPGWLGRDGAVAAVMGGNLFVMGGTNGVSTLNDVWQSNTGGSTWVQIVSSASWSARQFPALWVSNNRLWIGGGATNNAGSVFVNDVYSSADGATWLTAATSSSWSARWRPSYTVHGTALYMGPGTNASAIIDGLFAATVSVSSAIALSPVPATANLPFQSTLIPATATTPVAMFFKNNNMAFYYNGLTAVQVTDADYPVSTVYGVAYLDGTVYVMNAKGIIYGSDILAPTSWNALNFISAIAEADAGVAIARQLDNIIAFKEWSIEFFYNAGNATGSPLARMPNALLEVGLAAATSIAYSDNGLFFIAQHKQQGRTAMKFEGTTPKVISNHWIDRILNADDLATVFSNVIRLNGHVFWLITLKTSAITIAFDETTNMWGIWTLLTAAAPASITSLVVQSDGSILATTAAPHGKADGDPVTIAGATPAWANGLVNIRYDTTVHSTSQFSYKPLSVVSGSITGTITGVFYTSSYYSGAYCARDGNADFILDESTGSVFAFSTSLYQDNSAPIDVHIRTEKEDGGSHNDKSFNALSVIGDYSSSYLYVRYTDDDYQTYSKYRAVDLSLKRPKITQLGSARRRAFEFRHTANTALRIESIDIDANDWQR